MPSRATRKSFAWYQLGIVYERRGDVPRAALATAERYSLQGNQPSRCAAPRRPLPASRKHERLSAAQDIAMAARGEMDRDKKRRNRNEQSPAVAGARFIHRTVQIMLGTAFLVSAVSARPLPARHLRLTRWGTVERQQIEQIVHDYILAHPEILPEAMDRLKAKHMVETVAAHRKQIEAP